MTNNYLELRKKQTIFKVKLLAVICTPIIFLHSSCNLDILKPNYQGSTAILGALHEEVTTLKEQLTDKQEKTVEGVKFVTGKLKGRRVVIARTGAAKVNAAMTTTLLIEHFKPKEVIFTGIAGGINPRLSVGDVVIAEKTAQHDLGVLTPDGFENEGTTNPINDKLNPVFFPADKRLLKLAESAAKQVMLEPIRTNTSEMMPKIIKGTVVTGDVFLASAAKCAELRNRLGADAVEMEGAAVAQICYQQNIPYLVIRGISDKANEKSLEDVNKFRDLAAKNAASLAAELIGLLATEKDLEKTEKTKK